MSTNNLLNYTVLKYVMYVLGQGENDKEVPSSFSFVTFLNTNSSSYDLCDLSELEEVSWIRHRAHGSLVQSTIRSRRKVSSGTLGSSVPPSTVVRTILWCRGRRSGSNSLHRTLPDRIPLTRFDGDGTGTEGRFVWVCSSLIKVFGRSLPINISVQYNTSTSVS